MYEQYGLLDHVDGKRNPKRGIVLLDSDRPVQYSWEAESNWDDWTVQPLTEVNDRINELLA